MTRAIETHYLIQVAEDRYYRACDPSQWWIGREGNTVDDVTCRNCKRTKVFKKAEGEKMSDKYILLMERHGTWEEAEEGHQKWAEKLQAL